MKKLTPKPKGFTIIEVIIVLVVGAVIMIAVFLVVPQLQRASRESQQRQIAQRVLVAARQLSSSGECILQNLGTAKSGVPNGRLNSDTANCTIGIDTVTGLIKNPATGALYEFWTSTGSGAPRNLIYVFDNAKCNGNTPAVSSGSISVKYAVEPYTGNDGDQIDGQPRCVSD